MRPGYTLLELVVVLALLGMLLAVAMPPALRWRDRAAVRSARDELAAALAWTRMAAASRGGATLVLDPGAGTVAFRLGTGADPEQVDLRGRYGVTLDPGTMDPVAFHYDALGIGRLTNRTVRIHRGQAMGGVTISAYGRYRRW